MVAPWPPTWRPDIARPSSPHRIYLHTATIVKHAAFTGQYPVAVLSDCVVYATDCAPARWTSCT
ncbi:hypothetical protein GCM10023238_29910 [Streptomyces heliomycini]